MNNAAQRQGEWLGGSDMAPILGKDRFRTALDVYKSKIGEAEKDAPSLAMRMGTSFEAGIAHLWAEDEGLKLRRAKKARQHKEHPWLRGHFDRVIVGKREGVEVKASSSDDWGEELTDQVPIDTLIQCHTYLAVSEYDRWHVAALLWRSFGPPELRHYIIEPDPVMASGIIKAGERFLAEHVRKRVPPTPQSVEEANALWTSHVEGKKTVATEAFLQQLLDYDRAKTERTQWEQEEKSMRLLLQLAIEDCESVTDEAGKNLVTFRKVTQQRFSSKKFAEDDPATYAAYRFPSSYRKMHVTKLGRKAIEIVAQLPTDPDFYIKE